MSQQDVQIAFQAGFVTYELEDYTEGGYDIRYERFADLIRADEREACAKVCETLGDMNKGVYGEMQIGVYSAAKSIRARGDV